MSSTENLKPGLKGAAELVVGEEHTAPRVGSGRVHVLATPVMINLIEAAALAAIEHLLPAGHQSLGTRLDIRHFAEDALDTAADPAFVAAFWQALERLSVLDPTCGSGAFLFAALKVLEPLYEGEPILGAWYSAFPRQVGLIDLLAPRFELFLENGFFRAGELQIVQRAAEEVQLFTGLLVLPAQQHAPRSQRIFVE